MAPLNETNHSLAKELIETYKAGVLAKEERRANMDRVVASRKKAIDDVVKTLDDLSELQKNEHIFEAEVYLFNIDLRDRTGIKVIMNTDGKVEYHHRSLATRSSVISSNLISVYDFNLMQVYYNKVPGSSWDQNPETLDAWVNARITDVLKEVKYTA